ncbi:MAG: DUF5011 domain-containing protein, partial [Planctomycetia bacterium]|nr:DUF5011 domain-containing protein [Planctomycetia bacterium]
SMFDWESGGGYDYTLGIEFISDSGGVVLPPEPEVDAIAPVITLLGANLINLQVGDTFIDSGARAIDNIDGNLTALIVTASDVNMTVPGSYAVIYSVFDAAGNSAQKTRTVIVRSEPLIGRNLYVSVNGNDDWSGLVQSPIEDDGPFKTIQHAANVAMPGDTVYIREGTYDEIVIFTRSGSQQDGHITFTNFPAENPVITRTDSDTDRDTFYGEDVSFIRIEGLKFEKCVRNVISFRHSHYIEIKNNEISETNFNIPDNRGIRMGRAIWIVGTKDTNSSHILIEGNHIHHNHTGDSNGGYDEALTIVGNVNYFKVINNIVHDNDFIGIDIIGHQEGQWSAFGMNKYGYVANNISYNNGLQREWASGLYVDGADHLIVENNIVYDNNGPGIVVSQETKESTTDNVIVRFNTSWNNHYSSIGSHPSTGGSVNDTVYVHNTSNGSKNNEPEIIFGLGENNRIKNNIFIATSRAFSGGISGMNTSSWEIDYNCYIPMVSNLLTISDGHNSYEDFEQYQILTEKDLHSLNIENGYFADIINHDYRLTDQSPCIDQGGFLTTTILGGNGTEVPVKDARYFTSGWGLTNPDMIQIGNNHPVQVLDVNYETNTIIVSQTLTWLENDGVSYIYNGAKPDMGAFEY